MKDSSPPLVLAVHAATPPSCVALTRGSRVLARIEGPFGKHTDAWVIGAVNEALEEAGTSLQDVAAIAATSGPGTFTGIRVALATAAGLARGLGIPATGVGTLEALVAAARAQRPDAPAVLAVIDARRDQLYGGFSTTVGILAWGPELLTAMALAERLANVPEFIAVGPGIEAAGLEPSPPDACPATGAALLTANRLAEGPGKPLPPATPHYIRSPDAQPGTNPLRRSRRRADTEG